MRAPTPFGIACAGFSAAETAVLGEALSGSSAGFAPDADAAVLVLREDPEGAWRQLLAEAEVPVVLLSAAPDREQLREAMRLGASGYLDLRLDSGAVGSLGALLRSAADGQFVCDERLLRGLLADA